MRRTDDVSLRSWPLILEVMAPVADAGRRPPSVYQVWSLHALPFGRYGARCASALMGLVTLTFDSLTLKLVCESHLRQVTFLPNLGTQCLWVLELFAMYATDGQTDGQKQCLLPLLYGGGGITSNCRWNTETILSLFIKGCKYKFNSIALKRLKLDTEAVMLFSGVEESPTVVAGCTVCQLLFPTLHQTTALVSRYFLHTYR